ncbi:MAG TPA: tRNA (guanine-N2)-dimethyltransferase, partial [Gammaproteobacteria bacterium]|nr:tRNA (guanine-N2)-dimethyltransferase [Gammaproteobacteria bacterium]
MTPERFEKLRRTLLRRQPDLTALADSVNKPHNVSAILRTADA